MIITREAFNAWAKTHEAEYVDALCPNGEADADEQPFDNLRMMFSEASDAIKTYMRKRCGVILNDDDIHIGDGIMSLSESLRAIGYISNLVSLEYEYDTNVGTIMWGPDSWGKCGGDDDVDYSGSYLGMWLDAIEAYMKSL